MSLDTFKNRMADNVPGKIYVGDQCLDCDLCRQTAPAIFARNDEGGYSYVKKQPETSDELEQCREAIEGCCTETIFDDGDAFDWRAFPPPVPYHLRVKEQPEHDDAPNKGSGSNCCKSRIDDNGQQR